MAQYTKSELTFGYSSKLTGAAVNGIADEDANSSNITHGTNSATFSATSSSSAAMVIYRRFRIYPSLIFGGATTGKIGTVTITCTAKGSTGSNYTRLRFSYWDASGSRVDVSTQNLTTSAKTYTFSFDFSSLDLAASTEASPYNGLPCIRCALGGGNGKLSSTQTVTVTNISISVVFNTSGSYTVAFDGNGSTSGSTASLTPNVDTAFNLPANGFTKSYKVTLNKNWDYAELSTTSKTSKATFQGWQPAADSSTVSLLGNVLAYSTLDPRHYLDTGVHADLWPGLGLSAYDAYAAAKHYEEYGKNESSRSYTGTPCPAIWVANDPAKNLAVSGVTFTFKAYWSAMPAVSLPTPTSSGGTFLGWYTAAEGGSLVSNTYTPTKKITLYAHWQKNQYTITVNKTGSGTVSGETSVTHGESTTLTFTPATGYKITALSVNGTSLMPLVTSPETGYVLEAQEVTANSTVAVTFSSTAKTVTARIGTVDGALFEDYEGVSVADYVASAGVRSTYGIAFEDGILTETRQSDTYSGSSTTLAVAAPSGTVFRGCLGVDCTASYNESTGVLTVSAQSAQSADVLLLFELPAAPPEIMSVVMTYNGAQISANNKVPTGQGFLIAVAAN